MSPGLRAMNDQAAAAGPFAKAARLLENLAGVRLTVKRVERAAEASGTAAAAAVRNRAAMITARTLVPFPPSPLPDKLYAAIDGTGVPVTAKETAGRDGKGEDGRARTREVKLAVFFTQDKLDRKGYPVRDRDSSSYVATFEPASAFAGLVEAEGIRRGAGHVRQMTILGDGAAWIWNIASSKFPEATQIVDLFHAREHLHDLARSLEFMLGDRTDDDLVSSGRAIPLGTRRADHRDEPGDQHDHRERAHGPVANHHPPPSTARAAAVGFRDTMAVPPSDAAETHASHTHARERAAEAATLGLGPRLDVNGTRALLATVESDPDARVRVAALAALVRRAPKRACARCMATRDT